jgi:hypothetical protein
MTTAKQIAANRSNARRSTGPKTEDGKKIAKLNALEHGGLSPLPVLPGVESHDIWQAHLDGTLASLKPEGHLETVLAERVALILWRMNRLIRYEREVTAVGQERVIRDVAERQQLSPGLARRPSNLDEAHDRLQEQQRRLKALNDFDRLPDASSLSAVEVDSLLHAIAPLMEKLDLATVAMLKSRHGDITGGASDGWTVGGIRQVISAVASAQQRTPEQLMASRRECLRFFVDRLTVELDQMRMDLDHLRRERLLPDGAILDRLARYEAHLSRQLAQALRELQRLQAARVGEPVTPPVIVDVTLSGLE